MLDLLSTIDGFERIEPPSAIFIVKLVTIIFVFIRFGIHFVYKFKAFIYIYMYRYRISNENIFFIFKKYIACRRSKY